MVRHSVSGEAEIAVVGGGLVGMAVAYGLARRGLDVTVFDGADDALSASRGNFGLVWVQGKGDTLADYARWSRLSAALWPELARALVDDSGVDVALSQGGGFDFCLSEADVEEKITRLKGIQAALGGDYPFEYLGHNELRRRLPEIGPTVVGATWSPMDGHVNPLFLLRALHRAFAASGGRLVNGAEVRAVTPGRDGFQIDRGTGVPEVWRAQRVVLAAGLGNAALAPGVGLHAPVRPNRGQILVTERVQPFLRSATTLVRQVSEGAVQIGDSKEDAGFNTGTTGETMTRIARRAEQIFPLLSGVRIVRAWGALRVMSPDGYPIYDASETCPGASVVTCHSGVTLAAAHALVLAPMLAEQKSAMRTPRGFPPDADIPDLECFRAKRFSAPTAH